MVNASLLHVDHAGTDLHSDPDDSLRHRSSVLAVDDLDSVRQVPYSSYVDVREGTAQHTSFRTQKNDANLP